MQGEDVTAEIVVDDGAAGSRGRLTVLTLVWRPSDPLAVTMSLISSPDHPALPRGRWVVLRDFLRYGLEEPTGDGDVRITPEEFADRESPGGDGTGDGTGGADAGSREAGPGGVGSRENGHRRRSPRGPADGPTGGGSDHGPASRQHNHGDPSPGNGHGDGNRGARVWLELCRGDRQSDVRVDAAELRDFLDRTEVVLPSGEERPEQELDRVIETLLRT